IAEESGGTTMQTARASDQSIAIGFDFGDVVVGTYRYRTKRPRVCISDALVIHSYIEESRRAEGFAQRFHFFQMPQERFLTFLNAEHCLEYRRRGKRLRCVPDQRVVHAIAYRAFEPQVQYPSPAYGIELV